MGWARHRMQLSILAERLSICSLPAHNQLPAWLPACGFLSLTRTEDELSAVCEESCVPAGVKCRRGWRCFKVRGPLDFSQVGVLAALAAPLGEAEISIFVISTFDTDYLLVEEENLQRSVRVLTAAGHTIHAE
jgi:hypothetical protein